MKRKLTTFITAVMVVLITAGFAIAESAMTTGGDFPYFHLGSLVVGGLIITSLHSKYKEMRLAETVGSFALYTALITLFTNPVIGYIKALFM